MRALGTDRVRGPVFDQAFSSATRRVAQGSTSAVRGDVRACCLPRTDSEADRLPISFIADGIHSDLMTETVEHRQEHGSVTRSILLDAAGNTYREAARTTSRCLIYEIYRKMLVDMDMREHLSDLTESQISAEIREDRGTLER